MAEENELDIKLQGMKVDGAKKKGAKPIAGPQINRSRKGSTLTAEEKAEKRAKTRKAKERKTKSKSSNPPEPKYTQLSEQVVRPTTATIAPQLYVTPTPAPRVIKEDVPNITNRPAVLPPAGTTPSNPIKLRGVDPYSIVERLYGEIGYFILAEQMVPKASPPIKLIQIKLDDDRCINLFLEI